MVDRKLPKKVRILKDTPIAPDHIHSRLYLKGEVHEVGGYHMPEDLVFPLMDDEVLEDAPEKEEAADIPPYVDETLDHASGRYMRSAMPPEVRARQGEHPADKPKSVFVEEKKTEEEHKKEEAKPPGETHKKTGEK